MYNSLSAETHYTFKFAPSQDRQCSGVRETESLGGKKIVDNFVYEFDDLAFPEAFGVPISSLHADLRDLAFAIYFADRLSARQDTGHSFAGLHWGRDITIHFPVRELDRWEDVGLTQNLEQLLKWITGDTWHLHWEHRKADPTLSEYQTPLFKVPLPRPLITALDSGGLDSLAGLACQVRTHPNHRFCLLSVNSNERAAAAQTRILKRIPQDFRPRVVRHVQIPFHLSESSHIEVAEKRSPRSRGFLFLALGSITALLAGEDELRVYENGVGAWNLPYNKTQISTHNTRAVHPRTLIMMGRWVRELAGKPFRITNPFIFTTKAQMCDMMDYSGWRSLIPHTVTCGYPQRIKDASHCGACTSCILRRLSVYGARLSKFDRSDYRFDVTELKEVPMHKRGEFYAMEAQIETFKQALQSPRPWSALAIAYPEHLEQTKNLMAEEMRLPPPEVEGRILNLFSRYVEEWATFTEGKNELSLIPLSANYPLLLRA